MKMISTLVFTVLAFSFSSNANEACQSRSEKFSELQQWSDSEATPECQNAYAKVRNSSCFSDSNGSDSFDAGGGINSLHNTQGRAFENQASGFIQQVKACDNSAGSLKAYCSDQESQVAIGALQAYASCAQARAKKSLDLAGDSFNAEQVSADREPSSFEMRTASTGMGIRRVIHCIYLACSLMGSVTASGPAVSDVPVTPIVNVGGATGRRK